MAAMVVTENHTGTHIVVLIAGTARMAHMAATVVGLEVDMAGMVGVGLAAWVDTDMEEDLVVWEG